MISAAWLSVFLAVGPVLNPILGERVGPAERDLLPSGHHLAELADLWFVSVVNMQNSGAGISLFDPLRLSHDGRAWGQMHTLLGDLDITDPGAPGEALFEVPYAAWQGITRRSLWTDLPGFTWEVMPQSQEASAWLGVRGGGAVGGGFWLPPHLFDRDPAYAYGAPTQGRSLRRAQEATFGVQAPTRLGPLSLNVEGLAHQHTYLTLTNPDDSARQSALLAWRLGTFELTLGWQRRQRASEGGEFRFPLALTHRTQAQAMVAQLGRQYTLPGGASLRWTVGFGLRRNDAKPRDPSPMVTDLLDEWLLLARPTQAASRSSFRADATGKLTLPNAADWCFSARAGVGGWTTRAGTQRVGSTAANKAYAQTVYAPASPTSLWQAQGRAQASWLPHFGPLRLDLFAAADYAAVGGKHGSLLSYVSPAGGAAARLATGDGEVYALVRHEPETLGAQAATFLDTDQPHGEVLAWHDDNGDGVPDASETGAVLRRTGGLFHEAHAGLRRPANLQVAVGYQSMSLGPFRILLQGVGRWLSQRYTVQSLGGGSNTALAFHDPGGDGRGEVTVPGGGQNLAVYTRAASGLGSESYGLINDPADAYYLGVELNFVSQAGRFWFVNVGGSAYVSIGQAPFGNYPDRNDPGVIDEASAGPDASLHALGRYDHDRSFALKVLAGIMPAEGFSVALAARYRDGQPFSRILLADLPQGPTPLMATPRGEARHTFNMTWDLRARYALPTRPYKLVATLDVFNFFGSATELSEDARTGASFRRSLEVVPGRTLMAGCEVRFDE